jgi:hypothetical protein
VLLDFALPRVAIVEELGVDALLVSGALLDEAMPEPHAPLLRDQARRIGLQPVSSATRAAERDRLWPEVWSTTKKKSTRWC